MKTARELLNELPEDIRAIAEKQLDLLVEPELPYNSMLSFIYDKFVKEGDPEKTKLYWKYVANGFYDTAREAAERGGLFKEEVKEDVVEQYIEPQDERSIAMEIVVKKIEQANKIFDAKQEPTDTTKDNFISSNEVFDAKQSRQSILLDSIKNEYYEKGYQAGVEHQLNLQKQKEDEECKRIEDVMKRSVGTRIVLNSPTHEIPTGDKTETIAFIEVLCNVLRLTQVSDENIKLSNTKLKQLIDKL